MTCFQEVHVHSPARPRRGLGDRCEQRFVAPLNAVRAILDIEPRPGSGGDIVDKAMNSRGDNGGRSSRRSICVRACVDNRASTGSDGP